MQKGAGRARLRAAPACPAAKLGKGLVDMKKRILSCVLVLVLAFSLMPAVLAAASEAEEAAQALYELGLFQGVGKTADGSPDFDLDRTPNRNEAVTMLVRLLGKEQEAKTAAWSTPFTDVAEWAQPHVGYAYTDGLTAGTSATTYSGNDTVTASQYLTFILRALGYESGTDFRWDAAWELSDKIGLTDGQYNEGTAEFTRGDAAVISANALKAKRKGAEVTLLSALLESGVLSAEAADAFLNPPVKAESVTLSKSSCTVTEGKTVTLTAMVLPSDAADKSVVWTSSNTSVAAVSNGVVEAISKGTATITATTVNGLSASCTVTVQGIEWYSASEYRVGSDIPAGEYYAEQVGSSSGYYCIYQNTRKDDIEQNDIFNNYTFFTVSSGELLSLSRCRITSAANVAGSIAKQENGAYIEGCYRVGIDIPAGEYKFTQNGKSSGYYCIYSDATKKKIVDNDIFEGSAYCTVKAGEYLDVSRATFVCVEAASDSSAGSSGSGSNSSGITYAEVQTIESYLDNAYSLMSTASDNSKNWVYNALTIQYVSAARKNLDQVGAIISKYGTLTISGNPSHSTLNDWFDDVYATVSTLENQDLNADGYSQYDFRVDVSKATFAVADLRAGVAAILANASR